MKCHFTRKYFSIIISILFISLPFIQAQTNDVTLPPESKIEILTVNNPNSFQIDLPEASFEQTFYLTVTPTQYEPYPSCGYVPSRISAIMTNSYVTSETWGASGDFHMDHWTTGSFFYIFAAKSSSFTIYATGAFTTSITPGGAYFGTNPTGPVFIAIDRVNNYLYISDQDLLLSYDLATFHSAMNIPTPPLVGPPITVDALAGNPGFSVPNCVRVKIYNQKIFFVTKDFVRVYALKNNGQVELTSPAPFTFDANVLTGPSSGLTLDLKDIGFNGDLAFILDSQLGVYTVNINTNAVDTNLRIEKKRGEFLEVTSNSLIIFTATTSIMYEYFFVGSPITDIEFNRHILSAYGNKNILQTASDDHFLYITVDGGYSLIMRHSIPARFEPLIAHNEETMPYMGPYSAVKLSASSSSAATATVLFLEKYTVGVWDIKLSKPYLQCSANSLPGCKYSLDVQGIKRKCAPQTSTNPNDVCLIERELEIIVLNSPRNCHIPGSAAPTGLALAPNAVFLNNPNLASQGDIDMNDSKETPKNEVDLTNLPTYDTNIPRKGPYKPRKSELENLGVPEISNDQNTQHNRTKTPKTTTPPREHHHEPTERTREHISTETANQNQNQQRSQANVQAKEKEKENFMKHISPTHKTESEFTVSDRSQDEVMMAMVNENNSFMNGLIVGLMVLIAVLLILAIFAFWWCGSKEGYVEEKENSFEEDKSDLDIRAGDDKQNEKNPKQDMTQILTTFGDESKVYVGTDITQIEINEKSFN